VFVVAGKTTDLSRIYTNVRKTNHVHLLVERDNRRVVKKYLPHPARDHGTVLRYDVITCSEVRPSGVLRDFVRAR